MPEVVWCFTSRVLILTPVSGFTPHVPPLKRVTSLHVIQVHDASLHLRRDCQTAPVPRNASPFPGQAGTSTTTRPCLHNLSSHSFILCLPVLLDEASLLGPARLSFLSPAAGGSQSLVTLLCCIHSTPVRRLITLAARTDTLHFLNQHSITLAPSSP